MKIQFDNKVVLVTGASTGIGAATAIEFGKAGAKVVVNYNKSVEAAEKVVSEIKKLGSHATAIQADVSNVNGVEHLVQATIEHYGPRIDILVNNAGGLLERRSFSEMTEDLWDECYNLNVKSVYMLSQAVLPYMKRQKFGRIINVSSIAARNGGGANAGHYSSAKAAILTFTKSMAKELADTGITVNGVAPGLINTPFHDKFTSDELRNKIQKSIPLGREGTPEETAYAIIFLASDYSSYIWEKQSK